MPTVFRYHFQQSFSVSAREAYDWCTDFGPQDHALMGDASAKRKVTRVAESTLILSETFKTAKGDVEKQKIVELYPDKLSWNSTHLTGPNKYSQFLYEISADGEGSSHLDFEGLHLDYEKENLSKLQVKALADKLCKDDSDAWKPLAKAMAKDLAKT